jgi:hypothetical protein
MPMAQFAGTRTRDASRCKAYGRGMANSVTAHEAVLPRMLAVARMPLCAMGVAARRATWHTAKPPIDTAVPTGVSHRGRVLHAPEVRRPPPQARHAAD